MTMKGQTFVSTLYFAGAIIAGAYATNNLTTQKIYTTAYKDTSVVESVPTNGGRWAAGGIEALLAGFLLAKGIQHSTRKE